MDYIYDLNDICRILQISKATVRNWDKKGVFPMKKISSRYYITYSELVELMKVKGDQNMYFSNEQMKPLYDSNDISEMLKISKRTIGAWSRKGILPMQKMGNKYYIEHSELVDFMNNKEG